MTLRGVCTTTWWWRSLFSCPHQDLYLLGLTSLSWSLQEIASSPPWDFWLQEWSLQRYLVSRPFRQQKEGLMWPCSHSRSWAVLRITYREQSTDFQLRRETEVTYQRRLYKAQTIQWTAALSQGFSGIMRLTVMGGNPGAPRKERPLTVRRGITSAAPTVANPSTAGRCLFDTGGYTLEKSLLSVANVRSPSSRRLTWINTWKFTLEKSPLDAANVGKNSNTAAPLLDIKDFTLERNLINATSVGNRTWTGPASYVIIWFILEKSLTNAVSVENYLRRNPASFIMPGCTLGKGLLSAVSVRRVLKKTHTWWNTERFTAGENPLSVMCVEDSLPWGTSLSNIRDFTLQKSIMSARNVGKCFATGLDFLDTARFTLKKILRTVKMRNSSHDLPYLHKRMFNGQKSRVLQMWGAFTHTSILFNLRSHSAEMHREPTDSGKTFEQSLLLLATQTQPR